MNSTIAPQELLEGDSLWIDGGLPLQSGVADILDMLSPENPPPRRCVEIRLSQFEPKLNLPPRFVSLSKKEDDGSHPDRMTVGELPRGGNSRADG